MGDAGVAELPEEDAADGEGCVTHTIRMYITDYSDIRVDELTEDELRIVLDELFKASSPGERYRLRYYRADAVLDRAMHEIGRRRFHEPPDQATHLAERQPST